MASAAALLALTAGVVLDAAPFATTWRLSKSDHFEVYTTASEGRAREALTYFERVHGFFTDFMKMSPRTAQPTRLIVFNSTREYAPFRPNEIAVAFYQPGPDRDYIVMRSLEQDAYPIVVHEYVHLVIRHSLANYPPWLNEGLAEYFSTMEPEGAKMGVGRVPLDRLLYLKDVSRLIPITRLVAVDHDAPEYNTEKHAGTFYSESWALVHMLMSDPKYRSDFSKLARVISDGAEGGAAFQQVYGKSLSAVEHDLEGYIQRSAYVYFRADYKQPKATDRALVSVVETFDADLVTANLLANQRAKENDARAVFARLEQQQPNHLALLESRAIFEVRAGNTTEALPFLRRAEAAGTANPQLLRHYASLVRDQEPDHARELLTKAVTAAPDDIDLRAMLASMQLQAGNSSAVLATLAPITQLPAEKAFNVFQLLANAHLREQHAAEARDAAALAVKHARTPEQADYAKRLAANVDSYFARLADADAARISRAPGQPSTSLEHSAPATNAPGTKTIESGITADNDLTTNLLRPQEGRLTLAVGRITNLVCGSQNPILEVTTLSGVLRLTIDAPDAIRVLGAGGIQTDLQCGAQNVRIRVGYSPKVDRPRNTIGNLRLLDYTIK